MDLAAQGNKPYILVSKDKFELNCTPTDLFLALKVIFETLKKSQPGLYGLMCQMLIKRKVIDPSASGVEEINKLYKNPHKKD
jgi:hypothetical protein